MKVLVTGGTGYVGSHAVAAIVRAGHEPRLLVRDPARVPAALDPHGVHAADVVAGDVLDAAAVRRAAAGCDAVVHAAAVYSLDPRRELEMLRTNEQATETVLGTAVRQGLDPVVHVSTVAALARRGGSGPDLPLGDIDLPYARSKIRSEQVARRYQEQGAPVVTIYPGSVLGPGDPYRGDQSERLRWQLANRFPLWPQGGMHYTDVREVAAVIAAVLEPGRGPRRYVVPGPHVDAAMLYGALEQATGRRIRHLALPAGLLRPVTWLNGAARRRLPWLGRYPADREGLETFTRDMRLDSSATTADLGVAARPFADTVRDTVAWLVASGRVPARFGGRAAG